MLAEFLDSLSDGTCVYFLGDVFDYWTPFVAGEYSGTLSALRRAARRLPVYFVEGNRDFLAAPALRRIGVRTLGRRHELACGGVKVLLAHGDLQFNNDPRHSAYSRAVRSSMAVNLAYASSGLTGIAARLLRKISRGHYRLEFSPDIRMLIRYFERYDVVIAGHYHLNKMETYNYKGNLKTIIFLGEQTADRLDYLAVDWNGGFSGELKSCQ